MVAMSFKKFSGEFFVPAFGLLKTEDIRSGFRDKEIFKYGDPAFYGIYVEGTYGDQRHSIALLKCLSDNNVSSIHATCPSFSPEMQNIKYRYPPHSAPGRDRPKFRWLSPLSARALITWMTENAIVLLLSHIPARISPMIKITASHFVSVYCCCMEGSAH